MTYSRGVKQIRMVLVLVDFVLDKYLFITVTPLNSGHSQDHQNCPLLKGVYYWEKLIKIKVLMAF